MHLLLLSLACFYGLSAAEVNIWPQTSVIHSGSDVLWLNSELRADFYCSGKRKFRTSASQHASSYHSQFSENVHSWTAEFDMRSNESDKHPPLTEDQIVKDAVQAAIDSISRTSFVPWKFNKMNAEFDPEKGKKARHLNLLTIKQSTCSPDTAFNSKQYFDVDESYAIDLDDKHFEIRANSTLGSLRALETIKQLFYRTQAGDIYVQGVPINIRDRPRWNHRGLSIDIARNPIRPSDILRTLDAMATVKFSRLHLHATDSQSWPLEVPSLPKLAEKGAYRSDLVWSVSALENVQIYGAKKGISVFVEIDAPGHTASVAHGYPDLITAFNMKDWSTFALEPLSGQLKLNSPEVSEFMDTLLQDLLPRVAPYTGLYHMGGDEVNENSYLLDETVRSNDSSVLKPLFSKFMSRIVNQVLLHELQPIVWEEMILDWNLTFPKGKAGTKSPSTLVQVWRNSERISEVLERGYRVIFGDYHHWYLDCGFGVGFLDPYPSGSSPPGVPYNTSGGFPSQLKRPYLDYCNPYHNWREMLMYNPLEGVEKSLHYLIEGGEALMWSEQTDGIDLDFKLWPRAAAAAEVLWSGPRNESMLENATRRLAQWRERVVADLDLRSSPVTMTWCLMEGGCNL